MVYVTKHAINKAQQRFHLGKNYKETKNLLKKAVEEGEVVEQMNKFDCVVEYMNMCIIVESDVIKTVLTKEQYQYNKTHPKLEPIGVDVIREKIKFTK